MKFVRFTGCAPIPSSNYHTYYEDYLAFDDDVSTAELRLQATNYAIENAKKYSNERGKLSRELYFDLALGLSNYNFVSEDEFLANIDND